jgi:hypothetical protein
MRCFGAGSSGIYGEESQVWIDRRVGKQPNCLRRPNRSVLGITRGDVRISVGCPSLIIGKCLLSNDAELVSYNRRYDLHFVAELRIRLISAIVTGVALHIIHKDYPADTEMFV